MMTLGFGHGRLGISQSVQRKIGSDKRSIGDAAGIDLNHLLSVDQSLVVMAQLTVEVALIR